MVGSELRTDSIRITTDQLLIGLDKHSRHPQRAPSVPRSSRQTTPPKSVAFELSPHKDKDPGYETDDSGSTVHSAGRHQPRPRNHRRRRSWSVPHTTSRDHRTPSTVPPHHTKHSQPPYKASESESDSTIDLPDRFDAHGRLLPQKSDDPALEKFEDFINKFSRVLF